MSMDGRKHLKLTPKSEWVKISSFVVIRPVQRTKGGSTDDEQNASVRRTLKRRVLLDRIEFLMGIMRTYIQVGSWAGQFEILNLF